MIECGIICGNVGDGENIELARAFQEISIKPRLIQLDRVAMGASTSFFFHHDEFNLDQVAAFIVRGVGLTSLNRSFYRFDFLYTLEHRGRLVVNPAASTELALDKARASMFLDSRGIPTPATIVTDDLKLALRAFDALGGDVLVKPVYGSQGMGIIRLADKATAEHLFIQMFQLGLVFYLQEFHPVLAPPGSTGVKNPCDVRLLVLDGQVEGAMIRESPSPGVWKANVHAGGIPRPYNPPADARELALRSAESAGLKLAGVDLVFSAKTRSWQVIELNCAPGWTGLKKVSRVDYPLEIAKMMKRFMKR